MKKYNITGMSCASCSARIEKAVSNLNGVERCSVNLLTNSMNVEGNVDDAVVCKAVIDAGYGIEPAHEDGDDSKKTENNNAEKNDQKKLKSRLVSSLVFLFLLMYISMFHSMWNFPLPSFLSNNPVSLGLAQLILAGIVMVINQKFFVNGSKAFFKGTPNMDTLVALGSAAAFIYSTWVLFGISGEVATDIRIYAGHYSHEFYFETAAMILTLITVGKFLEARSKGRTADALKSLMNLAPKTAIVIRDGKEVQVPADTLKIGEVFLVKPGEAIPADGVVIEGITAVDESALTGESMPVDKHTGDYVTGATINRLGFIKCQTTRAAQDTTLANIIRLVSDTASSKAPISKVADRVSGVFVPIVISIAAVTFFAWLILGKPIDYAIARGISVLVISCPCALGLATPVAIMVGSGVGAKNGILFKTATSLEETGKIKVVALDKTGTLTKGEPRVTDVIPYGDTDGDKLVKTAVTLEAKSEHPLAKAIVEKAKELEIHPDGAENFMVHPGNGVSAAVADGRKYFGGNAEFVGQIVDISGEIHGLLSRLAEQGKTPLLFCSETSVLGIIAVADTLKADSAEGVTELKSLGIKVVMITGDNQKTASAIANQAKIEEIIAGVLPEGKSNAVAKLKKRGKVAMVGDGINDAPCLVMADVGIAIGAGSDVAIDAADVVLMKNSIRDVAAAIRLSRATLTNIHENLFWAFIYNVIGIPLAAGLFISTLGWQMNPMFGAAAMSLSSVCVVSNALRLNNAKIYGRRQKNTKKQKGTEKMVKTLKINGMMCEHCESSVKSALEKISNVESVTVSRKDGIASVVLNGEISEDVIKDAVENKGYTVTSIG